MNNKTTTETTKTTTSTTPTPADQLRAAALKRRFNIALRRAQKAGILAEVWETVHRLTNGDGEVIDEARHQTK